MRLVDFIGSLFGLIFFSPLLIVAALAIKLDSPGPIFYVSQRVGKNGNLFKMYKFRSMFAINGLNGPGITIAKDKRITRSGGFLRRTKIDELPQLINVLKGEMSLVGPRPEDPTYVAMYTRRQRLVLATRPGITSPASLYYHDEGKLLDGPDWEQNYVKSIMPHKLEIELSYLANRNILTDLKILIKTSIQFVLEIFRLVSSKNWQTINEGRKSN